MEVRHTVYIAYFISFYMKGVSLLFKDVHSGVLHKKKVAGMFLIHCNVFILTGLLKETPIAKQFISKESLVG